MEYRVVDRNTMKACYKRQQRYFKQGVYAGVIQKENNSIELFYHSSGVDRARLLLLGQEQRSCEKSEGKGTEYPY